MAKSCDGKYSFQFEEDFFIPVRPNKIKQRRNKIEKIRSEIKKKSSFHSFWKSIIKK